LPAVGDARQIAVGFSSWGNAGKATGLFTNPALLGLTAAKLTVYGGLNGYFDKEKRSFPVQDSFGDFLADNTYVVNNNWFPGFYAGINYRLFSRLSLALAYRQSVNRDFSYEEEVRGAVFGQYNRDPLVGYHSISSAGTNSLLSFGGSFHLLKPLHVGAALELNLPGEYEDLYEIEVIEASDNLAADHSISYRSEPEFSGGISAILGLTLDVSKHLSIMASYKIHGEESVENGLIFLLNDSTNLLPVFAVDSTSEVKKANYSQPAELRIGLKYQPENIIKTSFYLEAVYQPWSAFDVEYEYRDAAFDASFPEQLFKSAFSFRDVWKIHIGVEHIFFSGVPFRFGFYHDPNPIDAGMDRNWFTAGTGYQWDKIKLDLSTAFSNSSYNYPDLFPIEGEERAEQDAVREMYLFGTLTLSYTF